ncbi:protein adenylyltransferase SelO family protein [Microbacterium sp. NPDC064584]|uniref:protein adenylyltransferase SelO n=1 Tax=Microbacterium sp. NPDC064584 TaxID=3155817 RepID=UPI003422EEB5
MTSDVRTPERAGTGRPALAHEWAALLPELSLPFAPARPSAPRVLALNEPLAHELNLDVVGLRSAEGVRFLSGEPADARPVAQVYAGHQWGRFQPILGDGRAALLGEVRDVHGRLRDVHLKGSGPTPMSRGDGYAVIGPMLREYLMGEAMHALGVPTTRALAVVATGSVRPLDGLPGALLVRTATSHVRYDSFEYVRVHGDLGLLRRLADLVIARHYPRAAEARHPYRALLAEIVEAVARLTADWMRVGFVHGVLSTDNVLVGAETIDYGPCAFLDAYEPDAFFSSIDEFGRYAYERQPEIMRWNLDRLGEAVAPLLHDDLPEALSIAAGIVAEFDESYARARQESFRRKLGLAGDVDAATVDRLTDAALALLADHRVDFTGFWRDLAAAAEGDERAVRSRFLGEVPALEDWLAAWKTQGPDAALARAVNPVYIARNHIVEEVLRAATDGDLVPFDELVALLRDPFTERPEARYRRFARPAPDGSPRHRTFCGT